MLGPYAYDHLDDLRHRGAIPGASNYSQIIALNQEQPFWACDLQNSLLGCFHIWRRFLGCF